MLRALVISTCLAATATPALADSKADQAKAKQLYDDGLRRYNLAEYPQAIAAWKESYFLTKAPLLLFNIGQAYRLSGDCAQAMRFYENYKREAPKAKNKQELEDAVKLCASAPVKPDPVKPDPVKPDPVKPDPVKPDPVKPDPVRTEPVKPAPVTVGVTSSPPDDVEEPPPAPGTPGRTMRLAGMGVGGLGVILGGAGVFFALKSAGTANDLEGFSGEWGPAQQQRETEGTSQAKKARLFGAVGVGAIVVGGVLYVLGRRAGSAEAEAVAVTPTSGGLELSYTGRF